MFLFLLVFVVAVSLSVAMIRGSAGSLRPLWWSILLLGPTWLTSQQRSVQLDLRTAAAAGFLLGLFCWRRSGTPRRWLAADSCVCLLVLIQIASQYQAGDLRPLTSIEIARVWLLPYVVGRIFLGSAGEIPDVKIFARIAAALSVLAVIEAFGHRNLLSSLTGKTFGLLEQGEGYRWGLKRAQGAFVHPIFFGTVLILIMPWTLHARRLAQQGQGRPWWKLLPWLVSCAVLVSVSRGPQLALGVVAFFDTFFRKPAWRGAMISVVVLLLTVGYPARGTVLNHLSAWAGEEPSQRVVIIDGEQVEYTGTLHRLLLFRVYGEPLMQAGLLGFGLRMQGVQTDNSDSRFASIDNHYLRFTLQHGYGGLAAFVALSLLTLTYSAGTALRRRDDASGLAGAMFGSHLAVSVLLMTVWFAPDFGTVWLFSAGLAGCLHVLPESDSAANPELITEQRRCNTPLTFRNRSLSVHSAPA